MASIASIALSGMNSAQTQLNAAAHNVANMNTPGFSRQQVVQSERAQGGVATQISTSTPPGAAPESDVVLQLQAKNAFLANLAVFKTHDKMAGVLLNQSA